MPGTELILFNHFIRVLEWTFSFNSNNIIFKQPKMLPYFNNISFILIFNYRYLPVSQYIHPHFQIYTARFTSIYPSIYPHLFPYICPYSPSPYITTLVRIYGWSDCVYLEIPVWYPYLTGIWTLQWDFISIYIKLHLHQFLSP